jgi:hypothetical protein
MPFGRSLVARWTSDGKGFRFSIARGALSGKWFSEVNCICND